MMISPEAYIKELEDKSYEELLAEKARLNAKIEEFENHDNSSPTIVISPSPEVRYQCNLEYLAALCNLITKKYNETKIH